MSADFLEKVKEFDANIFASYRNERFGEVEERLRELAVLAGNMDEKLHVLDMAVNHFHFIEDAPHAMQALKERISLSPEDVEGWLGLAEHFHYHEEDLDRAAQNIEIALQKAIIQNRQVRQVLGVRIRISLEKNSYALVNESLSMLLEYELPQGGFDVALESDFIPKIPVSAVDGDVLLRYKALIKFGEDGSNSD